MQDMLSARLNLLVVNLVGGLMFWQYKMGQKYVYFFYTAQNIFAAGI